MRSACFVIAEIGSNHNGSLDEAYRLIDAAAAAGASAAKFQSYSADTLYSTKAPRLTEMKDFGGDDGQITPHELISRLQMPREWHARLAGRCVERGIEFMSTPFDLEAVDQLDPFVKRHKIASFDLTYKQLIQKVATCGKPVVLSTGHAFLGEVEAAISWVVEVDPTVPITLLHCVSQYPTRFVDVNLRAMTTLAGAFGLPVGLSDHTLGIEVAVAAVALGACVLEKHFTGDHRQPGPDHSFALEPPALADLVRCAGHVRDALGDGMKLPTKSEDENRLLARRSLHTAADLDQGHELRPVDIAVLRPGTGLAPALLDLVVGRRLRAGLSAGTPITWDVL